MKAPCFEACCRLWRAWFLMQVSHSSLLRQVKSLNDFIHVLAQEFRFTRLRRWRRICEKTVVTTYTLFTVARPIPAIKFSPSPPSSLPEPSPPFPPNSSRTCLSWQQVPCSSSATIVSKLFLLLFFQIPVSSYTKKNDRQWLLFERRLRQAVSMLSCALLMCGFT